MLDPSQTLLWCYFKRGPLIRCCLSQKAPQANLTASRNAQLIIEVTFLISDPETLLSFYAFYGGAFFYSDYTVPEKAANITFREL